MTDQAKLCRWCYAPMTLRNGWWRCENDHVERAYNPKEEAVHLMNILLVLGLLMMGGIAEAATLDMVVIGHNYPADGVKLAQDVQRLKAFQATIIPYSEIAAKTTWTVIPGAFNLGCVRPDGYGGRLIVCNSSLAQQKVREAGVTFDRVLILVNSGTYGGSGGTVAVAYAGYYSAEVLFHELTHTFGAHDEYVLWSGGTLNGATYANCYAGSVSAAWPYSGCRYGNWKRSSSSSLMRAINSRYFNTVTQNLLRQAFKVYVN